MNRFTLAAIATIAGTTSAFAGGLDRSGQSINAIFDDPGTLSFGVSHVTPDVTGTDTAFPGASYSVGEEYTSYSWSYANEINEQFSYAIIGDQPFGADIFYNNNPAASLLGGTTARLSSDAISFIGRYKFNDRFSVHGGLRVERAGGTVALNGLAYANAFGARAGAEALGTAVGTAAANPQAQNQAAAQQILANLGDNAGTAFAGVASSNPMTAALEGQLNQAGFAQDVAVAQGTFGAVSGPGGAFIAGNGYNVLIEDDWGVGVSIGAAYEIPEIALRLAITYHSEVKHETTGTENFIGTNGTDFTSPLTFYSPQSVNIDFQTGVNEKTLLLAGLRWTNWDDFDVIPTALNSDLANIDDSYRWTVGVARRFTPELVGLASLTYEKDNGSATVSPLGPNDGQIGISVGARYTSGNLNVAGGINYTKVGDAFAGVADQPVALFTDNSAIGVGFSLDYTF